MEIIDELENSKRKVYAGGIGYFSANGEFDTCIALRTAISKKNKRKLYAGGIGYFTPNNEFDTCIALRTALIKNKKFYVQAGAGIVADSIPSKEYEETVNKAKALINALK